ncbi:MAG: hypothetical protein LBO04_08670 [Spirochaetaceae bacterium]|jgi:hypothetical protein|nr:hypothetical protein [Spirochaetaceae bacterium]
MKKQGLILGFAAALFGAAFILTGCESPTDGSAGAAGTIYLSGNLTGEGIQDALDSGAPVVFAGVTQTNDFVIVPAGRGVKLVGDAAFTVGANATLVLEDAGSVAGDGKISSSGTVIAPSDLAGKVPSGTVFYKAIGDIESTDTYVAVKGGLTIGAGDDELAISKLAALTDLYVIGDLTLKSALSGTPTIAVKGNVTVSETQGLGVNWIITGDLTATKTPTTGGALKVGGTATFTEALSATTLDVVGAATFGGAATFDGAATFNDDVTLSADAAVLTLNGAVTLKSDKSVKAGSNTVLSASGADVVLTPAADGATLTPDTANKKITLGAQNLTLTSGKLEVPAASTLAVDTGKTLTAGKLALGAGSWKASGAAALIETDKLTLGSDAAAAFGNDDGTAATALIGGAAATNTFTATGDVVTLAQAGNALSITGAAAAAKLATGATAGIKVKAGLTITTATVDISTANTSVITLVDGDTAGITLSDANSVILLDSTKSTATSSKKDIDDLAIGDSVVVKAESDAGNVEVGSFTGAASDNTIVEDDSGFDIKRGIKTKS